MRGGDRYFPGTEPVQQYSTQQKTGMTIELTPFRTKYKTHLFNLAFPQFLHIETYKLESKQEP